MKQSALTIQFLGTGTSTGIPMIGCSCPVCVSLNTKDQRLRTSILVESASTRIVIDTTPDFRYQMLRSKTTRLNAVLFTHSHKDHIAGLDDIRAFNFFSGAAMDIYANASTEEAIRRDFYYAFSDTRYPGTPELQMHSIGEENFFVGDIEIQPIKVMHHRMPVLGFRMGNFTYITDANYIEATELDKIKGSSVLVLNALRKEKHLSHFTLQEALDIAAIAEVPEVYFTHISHQLGLHDTISAELPAHVKLAYDGLVVRL
ncbi:MBL fold metallo-hydrolase [Sediminibacterium sp.]|uniref:MBL fold metallo-hydrolase n=1 Tax=Sediminibacterium sp. TaxID=1917865 RepID=UPI003F72F5C6